MEQRVEAAFLYHAGLSYRRVEQVVGCSYEAVRQWYHRLAHLFDPDPDYRSTVAIDETKLKIEETEVYIWAAVDVETFEVIHIEVSPADLTLTPYYLLNKFSSDVAVNQSFLSIADRGTLGRLIISISVNHAVKRWRNGRWSKPGLAFSSTGPGSLISGSLHNSWKSVNRWVKAFKALHNAII